MIQPELRGIQSPDLVPPALPPDPSDCAVRFDALLAPQGEPEAAAEAYGFIVVTPSQLRQLSAPTWGRGLLIVPAFDWAMVVQAVAQFLVQCARPTWDEVRAELRRELHGPVVDPATDDAGGSAGGA